MDGSEAWMTDAFEQSSDEVWSRLSSSTGPIQTSNEHKGDMLLAGVNLANAVEEVISTISQKHSDPRFPERQAWEAVAALAKRKLKNLAKQEPTQEWPSEPAKILSSDMPIDSVRHSHVNLSDYPNFSLENILSSSFPEWQLERPYEPQRSTSFETCHSDLILSGPLTRLPDMPMEIDPHIDLFTGQGLSSADLTEGGDKFNSFLSELEVDLGFQSTAQTQNYTLQPTSSGDINMDLDDEEGTEEGNTGSNTPCAPEIPPWSDSSLLGNRQLRRGVVEQRKILGTKRAQAQRNTSQTGHSLRGCQPLSSMQEQRQAKREDTSHAIRLRRGRPSDRGVSCAYCALHKKRCVGTEPCDTCCKSKIYRNLCVPSSFKDSRIIPHRLYSTRITILIDNIEERIPVLPSSTPILIKISNGFQAYFEVELQRYIPYDNDALTHVLFRGLQGGQIPPREPSTAFGLRENTLSSAKIDEYCRDLCRELVFKEGAEKYTLANYVLVFAVTQCQASKDQRKLPGLPLVDLALRFWVMQAIFFKSQWTIVEGASSIGMYPIKLPGFWDGITLLPRLVNQELDRAFEKRMDELEKDILEKLQRAVFKDHRTLWCSIFLTCFIVLHGLERDSWNIWAWDNETQRLGGTLWPLNEKPCDYNKQNKYIADMVVSHFRVVNKGHTPFGLDWKKTSNQQLLHESPGAKPFVTEIYAELKKADSMYRQQLNKAKEFKREDTSSLDYLYTRKLVID